MISYKSRTAIFITCRERFKEEFMHRKTKYLQLAKHIYRDVRKSKLTPEELLPSVRDLMKQYTQTKQTVCNALKYLAFEKQFLRHIPGRGYYPMGKEGQKKYHVAFIDRPWDDIRLERMLRMKESIVQNLKSHHCNPYGIMMKEFLNHAHYEKIVSSIDGLLLSWSVIGEYAKPEELLKIKIPTVLFQGEYITDLPFSQVVPDHAIAMRELFRTHSPKRFNGVTIFFCCYPNSTSRRDAFIHYALEAGFTEDNIETIQFDEHANPYPFILKNKERFFGRIVLSTTDLLSDKIYNALNFLFESSRNTASSILVSYDNLDDCGVHPFSSPVISSIDYSRRDMISVAIRQLLTEINDAPSHKTILKIPTRLILRDSTFPRTIRHKK